MKKNINKPEVKIIHFSAVDVIATSEMSQTLGKQVQNDGGTGSDGYNENMFAPGRDEDWD